MNSANHILAYVLGVPGSGKSTLLQAALRPAAPTSVPKPIAHLRYSRDGIQLGAIRESFSGTDALPMDAQPKAIRWLTSPEFPYPYVVAEGDRLGNAPFFAALRNAGWEVSLVYLDTPPELAAERRAARGSTQNETWLRGRQTHVRAVVATEPIALRLDGSLPLSALVPQLRSHPVIAALRRASPFKHLSSTLVKTP